MTTIKIKINTLGEVTYEFQGVKGSGCKGLTAGIDALGTVLETKRTAEFFQAEAQNQKNVQQH